jgi:hypothetical protein
MEQISALFDFIYAFKAPHGNSSIIGAFHRFRARDAAPLLLRLYIFFPFALKADIDR